MKILFCAYDLPGHIASGPNAWIQRLIPDLRNQFGLDAEVLFIYSGDLEQCPTIKFFNDNNLPIYLINKEEKKYIADQVKSILKIIKTNGHSVLVANLVVSAMYSARFLKRSNIPVIAVLHSNDLFYKSVIKNFIEVSNDNYFSHVVTVSSFLEEKARENNINNIYIENIPCGTLLENNKATLSPKKLKVLYAGRLEVDQKQIIKLTHSFIEASKRNSNLTFTIVGSGSQEESLKELLNDTKDHDVNYKGAVLPSNISKVMLQHHIFTLLSDYEGMPIALMEAMACGLVPVCLSEESGINEIIEHGVNGFIVQNRDEDYREKLNILSEDPELWNQMSNAAIETIEKSYASKIVHKKWADLLLSFEKNKVNRVKIPLKLRLHGELLYYGDNRKPDTITVLKQDFKNMWMRLRLLVRPRARLKSFIKKNEK